MGKKSKSAQRGRRPATAWGGSDLDTSPALQPLSRKQQRRQGTVAAWEVDSPEGAAAGTSSGSGGDANSRQQRFSLPPSGKQQAVDGSGTAMNEDIHDGSGEEPSPTKVRRRTVFSCHSHSPAAPPRRMPSHPLPRRALAAPLLQLAGGKGWGLPLRGPPAGFLSPPASARRGEGQQGDGGGGGGSSSAAATGSISFAIKAVPASGMSALLLADAAEAASLRQQQGIRADQEGEEEDEHSDAGSPCGPHPAAAARGWRQAASPSPSPPPPTAHLWGDDGARQPDGIVCATAQLGFGAAAAPASVRPTRAPSPPPQSRFVCAPTDAPRGVAAASPGELSLQLPSGTEALKLLGGRSGGGGGDEEEEQYFSAVPSRATSVALSAYASAQSLRWGKGVYAHCLQVLTGHCMRWRSPRSPHLP